MIVVSGYHGFDNLGDEAILQVLCEDLVARGWERSRIIVLSHDPEATCHLHGVQSINRFDFPALWRILGQSQALISGGGSLLQDVTSKRTIPYYLGVVEMAFQRSVPVFLYGHGLGPVGSPLYTKWIARVFKKSKAFTVRDIHSAQLLDENKVPVPLGAQAVDPVFQLWDPQHNDGHDQPEQRGLVVNLRPYPHWKRDKQSWVKVLSTLSMAGYQLKFAPMGPGDEQIGKELGAELSQLQLAAQLTLDNYQDIFAQTAVSVTMRLHGTILSAISNVVPIALNYDPKVHAICEQLGSRCVELNEIEILPHILPDVLGRYDENVAVQQRQLARLQKLAYLNRDILPTPRRRAR